MKPASAQCPHCFTRTAAADGEVVCPGCERAFTPPSTLPPARKNPHVPYARALSAGGNAPAPKPAPEPAEPRPARRAAEDDERPRTRSRRKDDDEPVKRGNPTLPLVLIAGGVLAVLTVGGAVAVGAAVFLKPSPNTAPVAVANSPWTAHEDEVREVEPDPFGHRKEKEVAPAFPDPRPGGMDPWRGDPPPPTAKAPPRPDQPKPAVKPVDPNTNALVTKHKAKLKLSASSEWRDWPATHLTDGRDTTSWYSNSPDDTTAMAYPWVTVTFPVDVSVRRVTVLGNRDPQYLSGYTVTEGKMELLDENEKVIATHALTAAGDKSDFDLKLAKPTTVRAVRFTMTKSTNGSCGLGEFQVE